MDGERSAALPPCPPIPRHLPPSLLLAAEPGPPKRTRSVKKHKALGCAVRASPEDWTHWDRITVPEGASCTPAQLAALLAKEHGARLLSLPHPDPSPAHRGTYLLPAAPPAAPAGAGTAAGAGGVEGAEAAPAKALNPIQAKRAREAAAKAAKATEAAALRETQLHTPIVALLERSLGAPLAAGRAHVDVAVDAAELTDDAAPVLVPLVRLLLQPAPAAAPAV